MFQGLAAALDSLQVRLDTDVQTFAYDEVGAIAFGRGAGGEVIALDWDGQLYGRR